MAKITDPDHRLIAQKVYENNLAERRLTWSLQAEYGRWLLATLTAVQAGAIYLVASLDTIPISVRAPSLWVLVLGLELALLSGLSTWINWGRHSMFYERWNDANMLIDTERWPKDHNDVWIPVTYWSSLVLGIASAACIPIAGVMLSGKL